MRIGLVGCVKTKVDYDAPARYLYTSTLFRGRRSYVETTCDHWFILSARHGLTDPDQVLEPYEETLSGKSSRDKRAWSARVLAQLEATVDIAGTTFEVHAGKEYREFGLAEGLRRRGATVTVPAEHLGQGQQLAFYNRSPAAANPGSATEADAEPMPRVQHIRTDLRSYARLGECLQRLSEAFVQLSFAQVEEILGRPLPASARRHRAWWANESEGTHSHAAVWMGVGWLVHGVDLNGETVRFRRGRR